MSEENSEERKDGILKNIIGAIVSPRETMERVNKNPKIWRYLIPVTLIQLIIYIIEIPKLTSFAVLQDSASAKLFSSCNSNYKNWSYNFYGN
ncbi:hypothetical protein ACI7YW_09255 [Clostridium ljungdahlii]|uniref:hypothetical protein n=1 Tax=Clostridium ljungdahlii TaxID=1538 RepID=UPI0038674DD8